MKKFVAVSLIIITLIAIGLAGYWVYARNSRLNIKPIKTAQYYLESLQNPRVKMQRESIGFLPYWRIDDSKYIKFNLLTELNYFGLFVSGDGEFKTVVNGETNPGMREWDSEKVKDLITKSHIFGTRFTLSIISQDNDDIEAILDSEAAQKKLISNIINEINVRKLDGINIDFEYQGSPGPGYKQKFTEFSKKLKTAMKKQNPDNVLEISIQARSGRTEDINDFKELAPIYDSFIGMSYDYYGGSAANAGPIAPMTGFEENKFFFDVKTMYKDLEKYIPKEKILMGVPHYGWDWAVTSGARIQSTTLLQNDPDNYPAVMSYARAKEFKNFKKDQCKFDDYAKEPWCWYVDPKTNIEHQVWFQNEKSIGIKYDFANQQNFKGVAIWVLGYDKDYPELWNLMKNKFSK